MLAHELILIVERALTVFGRLMGLDKVCDCVGKTPLHMSSLLQRGSTEIKRSKANSVDKKGHRIIPDQTYLFFQLSVCENASLFGRIKDYATGHMQ